MASKAGRKRISKSASDNYRKVLLTTWRRFCEKTSLHGMKYIGNHKLSIAERLFWGAAFISAVVFLLYFVYEIYNKFDLNPVAMVVNPSQVTTLQIPFPAIKICNMNQAKRTVVEAINRKNDSVNLSYKTILKYLCKDNLDIYEVNDTIDSDHVTLDHFEDLLKKTSQSVDEMFKTCAWRSKVIDCKSYFTTEVTDEGICYTFNGLPKESVYREGYMNFSKRHFKLAEWNPEIGYKDHSTPKYPLRSIVTGSKHGLYLELDANVDDYYCSSTISAGFKILVYVPSDSSKIKNFGHLIPAGTQTQITINPTIYDADLNLRRISVDKRFCFFREERHLKYFKYYSANNCKLECESNYTNDHCGCIPFHLPRQFDEDLCMMIQLDCTREATEIMNEIESDSSRYVLINCSKPYLLFFNPRSRCNCYPNCYEIEYKINFSYGSLEHWVDDFKLTKSNKTDYVKKNIVILTIFFEDSYFDRYTKRIIYTFSDFLSNTGGLLGLFLGMSWISVIEIIYYLSKLAFNLYIVKKKKSKTKNRKKIAVLNSFQNSRHNGI